MRELLLNFITGDYRGERAGATAWNVFGRKPCRFCGSHRDAVVLGAAIMCVSDAEGITVEYGS